MNNLISRSELLKRFKNQCQNNCEKCDYFTFLASDNHCGLIDEVPTVDAVPVVHGEWIDTQPGYVNGFYKNAHFCSNCHDYYTTEYDEMNFCPNCGAKMFIKE